jgi:hypothetical protein
MLGILQPDGYAIVGLSGVVFETSKPAQRRAADRHDPDNIELLAEVGRSCSPCRGLKKVARIGAAYPTP